jgi:hypothetical protein
MEPQMTTLRLSGAPAVKMFWHVFESVKQWILLFGKKHYFRKPNQDNTVRKLYGSTRKQGLGQVYDPS